MKREIIQITSEEQWLEVRSKDITSTAISALFNLCPYQTEFELYYAKRDNIILPFKDNERMQKGKRMEQYAAQEVAQKYGWKVKHADFYARIPELRIGSSFDYIADCPKRGKGILEIKAVDYRKHKELWSEDEIPPHIEIQVRTQMLCGDYNWVCVSAHTGIYDNHQYFFERDAEYESGLISASKRFWHNVDNGFEPQADYKTDGDVIAAIYNKADKECDLSDDNQLPVLLSEYQRINEEMKAFEKQKDALKAEIHHKIKDAAKVKLKDGFLDAGWTKGSDGTVITPDMIGTIVGAKKGYRKLNCKLNKKG
jgi:putative phage-type endonuclease